MVGASHSDMRKGFDGLALKVQEMLKRDPHCGHLEPLTEPLLEEAYESGGEAQEGEMNVGSAFIAHNEAAELIEPRETAFDDPTMAPEFALALNPAAGNAWDDPAMAQRAPGDRIVVPLVGVELVRALARSAAWPADRCNAVNERDQPGTVVDVGRREFDGERDALSIHGKMPLRAGLAAIGRVRAGEVAPFFAGTLAVSTAARSQSMPSAAPSRSSMVWWMRAHTPACCHACSRRQQVMPLQWATS